jgi:hypothetical protein
VADVTYTEDRATFARDIFQPPHTARLFERAARYTVKLRSTDREVFIRIALEAFWDLRDRIKVTNDITRVWDLALAHTARSRPFWWVWDGVGKAWVRVKGTRLGRD